MAELLLLAWKMSSCVQSVHSVFMGGSANVCVCVCSSCLLLGGTTGSYLILNNVRPGVCVCVC